MVNYETSYRMKVAGVGGIFTLLVTGITLAAVGGTAGIPILFGVGLGITILMAVTLIGIREHNLVN
jgi:cyanate permease